MKLFLLALITAFATLNGFSQDAPSGKFGVGFQYSYPAASGITAVYRFAPKLSAQVIVGFGDYTTRFAGRLAYHFPEHPLSDIALAPYAFGQVGFNSYSYQGFSNTYVNTTAGVGTEIYLTQVIPNLKLRLEIGANILLDPFDVGLGWGSGLIYYF